MNAPRRQQARHPQLRSSFLDMNIRPNEQQRHDYAATLVWTGARTGPTSSYQSYSREHEVRCGDKTMRDGKLRFTEVVLRPRVTVAPGTSLDRARALHEPAHDDCYIANSVNFPVRHEPTIIEASD